MICWKVNLPRILFIHYKDLSYLFNFDGICSISKNQAHLHVFSIAVVYLAADVHEVTFWQNALSVIALQC